MTTHYALDFDGVICDSAVETGMTGWKVARQLWTDLPEDMPPEMIDLFRQVRPAMETGYEATLIMRCLYEGISPVSLLADFDSLLHHLIRRDEINIERLRHRFGQTRDDWIKHNEEEWIAMNPLFDGVQDKLNQLGQDNTFIITTKQERFVKKIFQANHIPFNDDHIFGLDRGLGKQQILADLQQQHPDSLMLFVEDRLPTLLKIIENEQLNTISLYFADWGYNTDEDKLVADKSNRINKINLLQFIQLSPRAY